MRKANYLGAGLLSFFGVYVIYESQKLPDGIGGVPGSGVFPTMIAVLLIAAAISLMISMFKERKQPAETLVLWDADTRRVYISMAILVAYFLIMPKVGFCVCSFLMLFGLIKWFSPYKFYICILYAAIITGTVFYVFNQVLKVPLRFGILI